MFNSDLYELHTLLSVCVLAAMKFQKPWSLCPIFKIYRQNLDEAASRNACLKLSYGYDNLLTPLEGIFFQFHDFPNVSIVFILICLFFFVAVQ